MIPSQKQLDQHQAFLEESVFEVHDKSPHFRRLIADIRNFAETLPAGARVVSIERTLLYGGISLLAPFFANQEFVSLDCSPESADARGAYNAKMVDDPRCIRRLTDRRALIDDTGIESGSADLVILPNIVHHIRDQTAMFDEMARILRPGGQGYIFEALIRELHQEPDDYIRYTPWGFEYMLREAGLEYQSFTPEGGPFSAIAYCWVQALEYFPEDERAAMTEWYFKEHLPELMRWDKAHTANLVRNFTSFPVGYSIFCRKPA